MRKSKMIVLTMITSTAAAVAACEPAPIPEQNIFSSVEQCVAGGGKDAECRAAQTEAKSTLTEHASKEACEAEFGAGKCETKSTSSGGGSVFVPAMMGFMMGQMMANGTRAPASAFAGTSASDLRPANSAASKSFASGTTVSRGGMASASAGRGGAGS